MHKWRLAACTKIHKYNETVRKAEFEKLFSDIKSFVSIQLNDSGPDLKTEPAHCPRVVTGEETVMC